MRHDYILKDEKEFSTAISICVRPSLPPLRSTALADLVIEHLTKKYGDVVALDDVSLTIGSGEIVGLLGPNGAGKSTLLKIVVGILRPTSGSVVLDGIDILREPEAAKKLIGYLPENASLYTALTVTEFLQFVGKIRGVSDQELGAKIPENLRGV